MKTGIIAITATLILCSWGMGLSAYAAKEKFQRSKPHVNVGTIGKDDRSKEGPRVKLDGDAPSSRSTIGTRQIEPVIVPKRTNK